MFARSALRAASRRAIVRPTTFTPMMPAVRAGFKSSVKHNDPEVPVVSYSGGQRLEEQLQVTGGSSGPVQTEVVDEQNRAQALDPEVYKHLTPTLAKFTLRDKVAIVTG